MKEFLLLRKRQIQRHEEDRPVDGMETNDILTNQMQICRPQLLEVLSAVSITVIANTGDIVGQCIQPYISNMLRIEGDRNAPGEGGSGYTQILQSRQKEIVHHLILSGDQKNNMKN